MKKIILAFAVLAAVVACNEKPEGYVIEGNITGELENGTQVFLKKQGENAPPVDIDTTTVENGQFSFEGTIDNPEIHYIVVDKLQGAVIVVLENGDIDISFQKDSLNVAKIKGTAQNEMLADFLKQQQAMSIKGTAIQKDLQAADGRKDEVALASLRDEMNDFSSEYRNFELDFIKKNPSALVSALLLETGIMRKSIDITEVKSAFDAFTPEVKETKAGKRVAKLVEDVVEKIEIAEKTAVGKKAPEFTAPGLNGEPLALNDLMGKLTLIDFWAAWCKPCRAENPNVVAVYKKYHDKGLNIVGVSLDRNEADWKKAIEDDGLTWNHISQINNGSPVAKMYNVEAIPAAFLIDENGIIVAKNLRGTELEAKVSELLD